MVEYRELTHPLLMDTYLIKIINYQVFELVNEEWMNITEIYSVNDILTSTRGLTNLEIEFYGLKEMTVMNS